MRKLAKKLLFGLILFEFVLGITLLIIFTNRYHIVQSWVNRLAVDGEVESFTQTIFESLRVALIPVGIILLSIAGLSFIFQQKILSWISACLVEKRRFYSERLFEICEIVETCKSFLLKERKYIFIVLGITLLAAINRMVYLSNPISHDEAYTFMAFAARGIKYTISNYHLPNNHVFHTILVLLSTKLFGETTWAIRLPAFLAGIALVPATYFVARCFYDVPIALVSTSLVALIPILIDYSTNARGYTLITLFSLLLTLIAVYLKDHKNLLVSQT